MTWEGQLSLYSIGFYISSPSCCGTCISRSYAMGRIKRSESGCSGHLNCYCCMILHYVTWSMKCGGHLLIGPHRKYWFVLLIWFVGSLVYLFWCVLEKSHLRIIEHIPSYLTMSQSSYMLDLMLVGRKTFAEEGGPTTAVSIFIFLMPSCDLHYL